MSTRAVGGCWRNWKKSKRLATINIAFWIFAHKKERKALPFSLFYANMAIDSCQCVPLHFMVPIGKLKGGMNPLRLAVRQCGDLS